MPKPQPKPQARRRVMREPSTFAGIAAALSPFLALVPPPYQLVAGAAISAVGALAVYLPERGAVAEPRAIE